MVQLVSTKTLGIVEPKVCFNDAMFRPYVWHVMLMRSHKRDHEPHFVNNCFPKLLQVTIERYKNLMWNNFSVNINFYCRKSQFFQWVELQLH
jgi:hypothetical protein